jgi:hypothetical protein
VTQGVDPEFKFQHHKREKERKKEKLFGVFSKF